MEGLSQEQEKEHRMEQGMGILLRTGVMICCAVMLAGAILFLVRHGGEQASYGTFHGAPRGLDSVAGVWREALHGSARGIIQLAALIMIATPVMRVVLAVGGFARMKDWKFTAISLIVLCLLVFGLYDSR